MMTPEMMEALLIAEAAEGEHCQAGLRRMILPPPVALAGTGLSDAEDGLLAKMDERTVFMMGDNPALPKMPERPRLLDFFRHRFGGLTGRHLLTSAKRALDDGLDEKIVLACLLHDMSNGCLMRADHGYWGAQLIAPYVSEEIAWAVQYHQCLRYFADPSVGYDYPESYYRFFGRDYVPPAYIRRDAEYARGHRWYMSARQVTLYDIYFFDEGEEIDPEIFTGIIGRNFREPEEGLGFDGSPVAHMWRTMIWPNNFL
ncbi:hypothetical protein [Rhizorhapis sp.]|uniref:hypothetical protein n=1 Tax=Rhizorhapis sp. TaxID=1968842 RepID=UPI002B463188|nr:hypothetical protein [Rhizorhapis sp.]HKR16578.1 hypothetical protein [Rhizorhapis sp.]